MTKALPSSQADPSGLDRPVPLSASPTKHLCTTKVPQDMHTSAQWVCGPPFLRVTPGKCQLKEFTNTSTRPCCQRKFSWTFTATPFLYAILISFFTGPPYQNLPGTTQAGLPSPGQKELSVEAICSSEHASFLQSMCASGQPSLDCFTEQWTLSRALCSVSLTRWPSKTGLGVRHPKPLALQSD